MRGPFDRRIGACLLNGYHPAQKPQDGYDGGWRSSAGFQWGDNAPWMSQDGTYFPGGSADIIKKFKVDVRGYDIPNIKFFAEITTKLWWNGTVWRSGLDQYGWPTFGMVGLNSRLPRQDYGITSPWPDWPPDKEYIPTTEVQYIKGYYKTYTNVNPITQTGTGAYVEGTKIVGSPYNQINPPYWPEYVLGQTILRPIGWKPEDDGFIKMGNNSGSDPEFWWYYKDVGEDIGADKIETIREAGPFPSTMYARSAQDMAVQYELPKAEASNVAAYDASTFLYAYTPEKTTNTPPMNWERRDLEIQIYASVEGTDECNITDSNCWFKDETYTATIHYAEGTCEIDRDFTRGLRPYPKFTDNGSSGQSTASGKLTSIQGFVSKFKVGDKIEWNNLSPNSFKRITDITISKD